MDKILIRCDVCDKRFEFGPDRFEGRPNDKYSIMVCDGCYSANWDGWASQYEERITRYLKAKGLQMPNRNDNGLLPRE